MKRLLLLISVIAFFTTINANPLVLTYYCMTELSFDDKGNWVIELAKKGGINVKVDSIAISSSTGCAKWKNKSATNGNSLGYIVLRNDSMLSNLSINPLGDNIEITTYIWGQSTNMMQTKVAFGNHPNSNVKAPKSGQSISTIPQYICVPFYDPLSEFPGGTVMYYECGVYFNLSNTLSLDNSPTIGSNCDSTGMCGTLQGHLYDANGRLITNTNMKLEFPGNPRSFSPNADGSYSTFLFANRNKFSTIYNKSTSTIENIVITPLDIEMDPNSVVIKDIYLTDFLFVSTPKLEEEKESVIKIFPNPVKDLLINYEIEIPVKSAYSYLELINIEGQIIELYTITENTGKFELPENIKNGVYTINLIINNKRYSTTKVLISR